jgi:acyl dehydratase
MLAGMTDAFAAPIEDRWFEDYKPGAVYEFGYATLTTEELVDFATRFDPQPIHVDPVYAAAGPFGGLIASGWHTTALFMGMFVRSILLDSASMGSPGVEEIRWTAPVRPGDRLTGRVTVTDVQPSSKRPDRGTVFTTSEVRNQDGVVVMTLKARGFFRRRSS